MNGSPLQRFWAKVDLVDGPLDTPCWLWTAAIDPQTGYARFHVGDRTVNAHAWAFDMFVGPPAEGLQRDHLCEVRHCVNPAHLDAVTPRENPMRSDAAFSGARLRQQRSRAGLSRELLAIQTGRSVPSITSYELGRIVPPTPVVCRLADVLECSIGDLFAEVVA